MLGRGTAPPCTTGWYRICASSPRRSAAVDSTERPAVSACRPPESRISPGRRGPPATHRPVTLALVEEQILTAIDRKPKSTTNVRRVRNIVANPRVAMLCDHYDDDWTRLWWIRADGRAEIIEPIEATAVPRRAGNEVRPVPDGAAERAGHRRDGRHVDGLGLRRGVAGGVRTRPRRVSVGRSCSAHRRARARARHRRS